MLYSPELSPLLFVARRYNQTNPYEVYQVMGKAFNRPLITFEENWHTILFSGLNQFAGEEVNDYFLIPDEIRG